MQMSNFMKIPPMEADLLHADGRTDRQRDNEAFLQYCERACNCRGHHNIWFQFVPRSRQDSRPVGGVQADALCWCWRCSQRYILGLRCRCVVAQLFSDVSKAPSDMASRPPPVQNIAAELTDCAVGSAATEWPCTLDVLAVDGQHVQWMQCIAVCVECLRRHTEISP